MILCSSRTVLVIGILAAAGPAIAQTTHDVELAGTSFTPSVLTIQVGDTVHWVWISGTHNVVSGVGGTPDGNFDSGAATSGATFDVTFDQQFLDDHPMPDNIYPYYCEPHLAFGMTGTITVEQGNGVPALSGWGAAVVAVLLAYSGVTVLKKRRMTMQQRAA